MTDRVSSVDDQLRLLVRDVLWALVTGVVPSIEIFTPDVVADSVLLTAANRDELIERIEDRQGVFSNVEVEIDRVACDGSFVAATWRFRGVHTGPLLVNDDLLYEGSGRQVGAVVRTRLQLRDGRVCCMRHELDIDTSSRTDAGPTE